MNAGPASGSYICARWIYGGSRLLRWNHGKRFTQSVASPQQSKDVAQSEEEAKDGTLDQSDVQKPGRLSERLAQMTEETMEQGGPGAERAVHEAGFSEKLKKQLEAKILASKFKSENPAAFAQLDMPSSAGAGTQRVARSQPWIGTEPLDDAALRMLNDAHKPLHSTRPSRIPQPKVAPSVDLRMRKAAKRSPGERLVNARDRTSTYALSQASSLSEKEREQMRKNLKERFTAGARPMPATVQGLASLANERIEDAIARGQFKNITRGKGKNVERDHNADSPFLDTTEYFMNKMIQKQDIVPPWIEKQQELVKAAAAFRGRLRNDWKRHAARAIASRGGSLDEQVRRAEAYAEAEVAANPSLPKREALSEIDNEGRLSQVTITETPMPESNTPEDVQITVIESLASESPAPSEVPSPPDTHTGTLASSEGQTTPTPDPSPPPSPPSPPRMNPFRDPAWLSLESSYHNLAIQDLNNLTRSYNLQAPDLAKKPYFSLNRELRSCYADVAPQLPGEIRERGRRPEKIRVEVIGHRPGGVLEKFSTDKVQVYDSQKPKYGFREFWRDLWSGEEGGATLERR